MQNFNKLLSSNRVMVETCLLGWSNGK
jgi:hypothetical protein